ncbi:hypothetical protein HAX54_004360 [Datura stramonium]|uniref:Uncharacterized protein n=1 Tax=Datura stramonium TaxID=4076 RepID=A0ABS8T817_DATST|nr:hypothetical protein [Datura stramonium]
MAIHLIGKVFITHALRSATGGPLVVLRESPVISRIDLLYTACWHQSAKHWNFTDQNWCFADGAPISMMFILGHSLTSVIHGSASAFHRWFADVT